ncbi:MAG: RDD family protein [Thermoanaerobaculia bacterium]
MNPLAFRKRYVAHETDRMSALDGAVLANFGERGTAFLIDVVAAFLCFLVAMALISLGIWAVKTGFRFESYAVHFDVESGFGHAVVRILIPVLYFGLSTWIWNGRTLGKRIVKIRVVSLAHDHMSLWHSIERALGYAAAALEFGFGFFQFFIHPNRRTVQDRIAETIVILERTKRASATPNPVEEETAPPEPVLAGSERG